MSTCINPYGPVAVGISLCYALYGSFKIAPKLGIDKAKYGPIIASVAANYQKGSDDGAEHA